MVNQGRSRHQDAVRWTAGQPGCRPSLTAIAGQPSRCPPDSIAPQSGHTRCAQQAESPPSNSPPGSSPPGSSAPSSSPSGSSPPWSSPPSTRRLGARRLGARRLRARRLGIRRLGTRGLGTSCSACPPSLAASAGHRPRPAAGPGSTVSVPMPRRCPRSQLRLRLPRLLCLPRPAFPASVRRTVRNPVIKTLNGPGAVERLVQRHRPGPAWSGPARLGPARPGWPASGPPGPASARPASGPAPASALLRLRSGFAPAPGQDRAAAVPGLEC